MDDLKLWQQIRTGDETAFKTLFYRYHADLVKIAAHYVQDGDTARDISQDLFVSLWHKRKQIQIRNTVRSYLQRSVRNRCINYLKKEKKWAWEVSDQVQDSAATPQVRMELADMQSAIELATKQMPPVCRSVFLLRRMEGMALKEIAQELKIAPKTVENHLTRAHKILRRYLMPLLSMVGYGMIMLKML